MDPGGSGRRTSYGKVSRCSRADTNRVELPESEFESVTVMVWDPAVFSVAEKVPVTLVIIDAAGNEA